MTWLSDLHHSANLAALAECARCKGRLAGDCSDQCRFWLLTATAAEREVVGVERAEGKGRGSRTWVGPVRHHERGDGEAA